MVIKNFKDYLDNINEGLIKTNRPDVVLNKTLQTLHLLGVDIRGSHTIDSISVELPNFHFIPINKVENIFDVIMVYMVNMGGWFPSYMEVTSIHKMEKKSKYDFVDLMRNHDSYETVKIIFEAKFGVLETNIPDKLYHISIKEYDHKILKNGLIPRSKSKLTSHLDRIFVCKTISDCESLVPEMMMYYSSEMDNNIYVKGKKKYKKNTNFVIFEIDNTDQFIKNLYKDPRYDNGYYVIDNIPPTYNNIQILKIVKEI